MRAAVHAVASRLSGRVHADKLTLRLPVVRVCRRVAHSADRPATPAARRVRPALPAAVGKRAGAELSVTARQRGERRGRGGRP